jgi:hypothetical protein
VVGGYALMEFETRDAAVAWTRRFMELHRDTWPEWEGECEVRPIYASGRKPAECG